MVDLISDVTADVVRRNLERVHAQVKATARDPQSVETLAATKYLPDAALAALEAGGITLVGENRAQQLVDRASRYPELTWDFIGALQSRKVPQILPFARYIHSVASESALAQLHRYGTTQTKVLIEVNVAGEAEKSGVQPAELSSFLDRCPVAVVGLMTMPPATPEAESSRPYFAALAALAARHGLQHLSMGTSQDYVVAVQEGATIIRLGSTLFRESGDDPA